MVINAVCFLGVGLAFDLHMLDQPLGRIWALALLLIKNKKVNSFMLSPKGIACAWVLLWVSVWHIMLCLSRPSNILNNGFYTLEAVNNYHICPSKNSCSWNSSINFGIWVNYGLTLSTTLIVLPYLHAWILPLQQEVFSCLKYQQQYLEVT